MTNTDGHQYGVRDVEALLRLPRSTIRALIAAGFVTPARGPRNAWRFSFQDLIVLRTAQTLVAAKLPSRRITRSLRELRRHLPATMPLSGLRITAVDDKVVVKEGEGQWQAESGQYLLAFGGDPADGSLNVVEQKTDDDRKVPLDWFAEGAALERVDAVAARRAYREAIAADPKLIDAYVNLGRLLQEAGDLRAAEKVYRDALDVRADAIVSFNLGVLLEDLKRDDEAARAYEAALRQDPLLADGHYNLALLCEKLGRPKEAIRHMSRYRVLSGARTK